MGLRPLFSRKQVIISKFVKVKIVPSNFKHYQSKGYKLTPLGAVKHGFRYYDIDVKVEDIKGNTAYVKCRCDKCGIEYNQRIGRNTDICRDCRHKDKMRNNSYGSANKGKTVECMHGVNHPRWNPNKSEMREYISLVYKETRKHKKIWSKWPNADKIGVCGTKGAYQLDHKVSIKYGFDNLIPAEIIGGINNLEIITWESNREKSKRNSVDLWDLLE